MRKILLSLIALAVVMTAGAQSIGQAELKEIQGSFVRDASTVAIQNALTTNKDIQSLTYNHEKAGQIDHFFKYHCDVKGITNQLSSGRCWMFTSMNVLRPTVMKKYDMREFDFSHNYCFFWDLFEKANLFLENIIATADRDINDRDVVFFFQSPVSDGGVWNLFWDVAEKYGVVPQSVMPETEHSNNTAQMRGVLNELLRTGGWHLREMHAAGAKNKALEAKKIEILKEVYRVLALCLGEPQTEFTWRYRDTKGNVQTLSMTPMAFYKSIVPDDYDPDTFIMIMNDPTREYYKVYDIASYRNTYEGINWRYLNLPNEEIKPAALASIKDNTPLYMSCDVGKQSDRVKGIMDTDYYDYQSLFGITLDMDKKARILTRQSGSSHAMTLIGCDTDENDVPVKWELENSWGPASGNHGYVTFTDAWFDAYLFRIVINKKYLSEKAVKAAQTKPIELPAWDYMF